MNTNEIIYALISVRVCRRRVSAPLKASGEGPFPRQERIIRKGGGD